MSELFFGVDVSKPSFEWQETNRPKMKSEKVGKVKGLKERNENDELLMLCHWIRGEYPEVMFWCDMSGVKLPIGLAVKVSQMKSNRAIPDLFIAHPAQGKHGLFIEYKKTGVGVKRKNGNWMSDHVKEQAEVIEHLRTFGYGACFCAGLEEAKKIIALYLR